MSDTKTVLETKEKSNEGKEKRKTITNWRVLEDAGFYPIQLKCEGYKGSHPSDLSCHTSLVPNVQSILGHMNPNHGGGWFHMKFRISDGEHENQKIWRGLEDARVELQELWCPHCRENVPLQPRRIEQHLKAHAGAIRVNIFPQTLCMTLSKERPDLDEMDALYDSNAIE